MINRGHEDGNRDERNRYLSLGGFEFFFFILFQIYQQQKTSRKLKIAIFISVNLELSDFTFSEFYFVEKKLICRIIARLRRQSKDARKMIFISHNMISEWKVRGIYTKLNWIINNEIRFFNINNFVDNQKIKKYFFKSISVFCTIELFILSCSICFQQL